MAGEKFTVVLSRELRKTLDGLARRRSRKLTGSEFTTSDLVREILAKWVEDHTETRR